MSDYSSLGRRILYGLEKSEKTQADLSRYTGVKTATVSQWCSGKVKTLKSDNALKVSTFLGVDYNWLVTGKGNPEGERVVSLPDDVEPPEKYLQIKEYTLVECGAGPGCLPTFEEERHSVPATYRESFFKSQGLDPDKCLRFKVSGDSMEPVLFDGDTVLVNTADTWPINNNHVYVLVYNSALIVKRLICQLNGDLVIRSEKVQDYRDQVVRLDDAAVYVKIIGRVVEKSGNGGL